MSRISPRNVKVLIDALVTSIREAFRLRMLPATLLALLLCTTAHAGTYVVRSNDSLWKIAKKTWGNGSQWPRIYAANRNTIKNPNRIFKGMKLTIPDRARTPRRIKVRLRKYCDNCRICQTNGRTSTGESAYKHNGVAAPEAVFPRGTVLNIPGFGYKVVNDTGGGLRSLYRRRRIVQVEICTGEGHRANYRFGHKDIWVTIHE